MSNIVEYHKLRPEDLAKRREKCPIAYIGLGILEWHGLHNPLGLDGVKADAIACYFAEKLGGIVMPPQFWGDNRNEICELVLDPLVSPSLPKSNINHSAEILKIMKIDKNDFMKDALRSSAYCGWQLWEDLMVRTFFQIETLGFLGIVPIPGHYPLFAPLERAIDKYKLNGGACSIFVLKDPMFSEDGNAGDHAAKFETSLMLALKPELVDISRLDSDFEKQNIGVVGEDPRKYASKEFGFEILDKFEQLVSEFYRTLHIEPV